MTRFLKRCGAVLILFVVGSTCVLATPSASRTFSPSGSSASGGNQFTAYYDDSKITAVEVKGSLTYYSGATKTGWGTASDVMNCSFTITGVPDQPDGTDGGLWDVYLTGTMEIAVSAENYQTGAGGYYSEAYANFARYGPDSQGDYSTSGNVYIRNEDTLSFQNLNFSNAFIVDQNIFSMQYRQFASGQIRTDRPEVTVKAVSETGTPIGTLSFAIAYDSNDPDTPIYIHRFDLE